MVVFGKDESVIRRMHQRRYEKGNGKRWAGQKKRTQAGGAAGSGPTATNSEGKERPHSAPLQAQLLTGSGVIVNSGNTTIEARLGIVKKNRRSNSAIIGLNCVDLTKDDNKDSRKRIIDFIKKETPETGSNKPVKQRANSVPQAQLTALEMEMLQQMEAGRDANSDDEAIISEESPSDPSQPFVTAPVEGTLCDADITSVDSCITSLLGDLLGTNTESDFLSIFNLS
eukprot:TRINITY_DN7484_c3_g1_i1.p1 TRINITY_DN7484_c3_g1~~TRINITY_DN7484_c3_g1_i1.p1  ORF type:complete len:227 (+),score=61.15 TRINITY_DN7484_c3_g1_i1:46-726(+)